MNSRVALVFFAGAGMLAGGGCSEVADGGKPEPGEEAEVKDPFEELANADWNEVFFDPCTQDWRERWFLDGLKARLSTSESGMDFFAGPEAGDDSCHAVLWTKRSFEGDVKIEYEYTRLDTAVRYVTILYVQATGSGQGEYKRDILKWADLRKVPSMRAYFNNMNTYHISYAAYGTENAPGHDYIRARRYMPEAKKGLKGTDLEPDHFRTGLFATGVPHRITVVKRGSDLYMHVRNSEKELLCRWENRSLPPIREGRIGLRHMYTRGARYRDFRVSVLDAR